MKRFFAGAKGLGLPPIRRNSGWIRWQHLGVVSDTTGVMSSPVLCQTQIMHKDAAIENFVTEDASFTDS